jgi:2-polyprenyl-6-methoxyphenol hydroxylase-like FAD-dependent oxidoreductase
VGQGLDPMVREMRQNTALISGAGIAGPAAAYWLNAAGWETTVVERAPRLRTNGYVIDFWGLGYDLAERMGLRARIERVGYHMKEVRMVGEHGERVAGFGVSAFDELTGGRFVTLPRSELSRLMLDEAAPPTRVRFGDEVVALQQDEQGVDVTFSSGAAGRYDLVIAAGGLHSGVRRLVFGPDERFEKPLGYAVAAFEADGYEPRDPDVYMMYGRPGRMIGRFTLHGGRSLFLFIFTFEGELPGTLAAQKALLRSIYGEDGWEAPQILQGLDAADDLYLDRVSQIIAPAWSKGRVVLLGDAAFCVSLLAGQGSALAIVAAYVLAGELARSGNRIVEALENYERLLRPYIATKQAGAVRFAGALAPRTRFGAWFRNLVMNALAIPGLARFVVGREIMDRLELPDYPLARARVRGQFT